MESKSCYDCNHVSVCFIKDRLFDVLKESYFLARTEETFAEIYSPIAKNCSKFEMFKGEDNE